MTLQMTRTDQKAEIRRLLEDWARAARAGDLEGIMAAYAPDILSFDAIAQLQVKGADAYRKHWEMCVEMCSSPMTFEIHDLGIEAGDDVAFAHYLLRCGGTGPDGKADRMDARDRLLPEGGRNVESCARAFLGAVRHRERQGAAQAGAVAGAGHGAIRHLLEK